MQTLSQREYFERLQKDVLEELVYFAKHLTFKDRDERSVILIGHLLVEEQLVSYVHSKLARAAKIERFSFSQYLQLAEAMTEIEAYEWIFGGCRKLNQIRNRASHNLDTPDVGALIDDFVRFVQASSHIDASGEIASCNLSAFRWALLSLYAALRSMNRSYAPRLTIPTLLSGLLEENSFRFEVRQK